MKKKTAIFIIATIFSCVAAWQLHAQKDGDTAAKQTEEYAMIRWGGRENTHWILPGYAVEFIGPQLAKLKRPERADERAFYMTAAMNAMAKNGWTFAGMTSDEIVMKRPLSR